MKKFKGTKKIIALLLSLSLITGMMPATAWNAFAATEDTALTSALAEAKAYTNGITINNGTNDPATVVKNFKTHFTWDHETRENSSAYLYDWSYYNGVVFEGLEYLYENTDDAELKGKYKDYIVEYMSSMINQNGTWATCSNNSSKTCAGYDATHGADCYKTASLLLDTYEMTGDSRYLTMAETLYADLDAAAEKYLLSNAGNNFRHTWATNPTPDLWLDGLYMILPFRAEYAKYKGDTAELNLIVSRMQWVSDNMYNSSRKLFYHAADSSTSNSGTHWLRSIGWYAAAIVDIMDSLEEDSDNMKAMKAQLVKVVDGMKACQNADNGMWLNNMTANHSTSNPYETSGTALVCYAVMKAVNEGWLDDSYADMAIKAFKGICENKLEGNNLTDICFKGVPSGSNSTFYDNEGKGVGPFIMLYAEVLEYVNEQGSVPDTDPDEPVDPEEPDNPVVPEDPDTPVIPEEPEEENAVTETGNLVGEKVYTLDTDGVIENKEYLIVYRSGSNSTSGIAMSNNNSSTPGKVTVTINGNTVTGDIAENTVWTFGGSGTSRTIKNGSQYVYLGSGSTLNGTSRNLTITHSGNGQYTILRTGNTNYLRYNTSGTGSWGRGNATNLYLYEEVSSAGAPVTLTVSPDTVTMTRGATKNLAATVTVAGETVKLSDCIVTWESSDTSKVTVENGVVTGVADGKANITVTLSAITGKSALQNPITLTIPVKVEKKVTSAKLTGNHPVTTNLNEEPNFSDIKLEVTYEGGNTETITLDNGLVIKGYDITKPGFVYANILYQGKEYGKVYVTVEGNPYEGLKEATDYPEYPAPGAVRIDKTATHSAEEFNNTGVTHVELDVAGISTKKGVNVIMISDISNSMSWDDTKYDYNDTAVTAGTDQRLNISKDSAKTFANTFLADNTGAATDNTFTLLAFAGIDGDYNTHDDAKDNDDVYQLGELGMTDVDAAEAAIDQLVKATTGGTNYDYAFQQAYDLSEKLYEANGKEVYIVFMTDGVPTHYNGVYYKSRSNTDLTARMQYVDPVTGEKSTYTSNGKDRNGNSIDVKANQDITVYYNDGTTATKNVKYNKGWSDYVINNKNGWAEKVKALDYVSGVYSIGFGMKNGSVTQGATSSMPTLNNVNGGDYYIPSTTTQTLLKHIASTEADYHEADNAAELNALYSSLATKIKYAGTSAQVTDTIGSKFTLQTANYSGSGEKTATLSSPPSIAVTAYDLYTKADGVDNELVGTRKPGGNAIDVMEYVQFNEDGTEAYSDQIGEGKTNIMSTAEDGTVTIDAFYFTYTKTSDGVESFTWTIGNITDKEIVLGFDVYLKGALEGKANKGTYYTNEEAVLEYIDINGDYAKQIFDVPSVNWGGGSTTIRFYLVNENGEPVNHAGNVVPWANRIYVGDPVNIDLNLNADMTIPAQTIEAAAYVPGEYFLYDHNAQYTVHTASGEIITGGIEIAEPSEDAFKTTYDDNGNAVKQTGAQTTRLIDAEGAYYTWSVVGFGVRYGLTNEEITPLNPDTIVMDYGKDIQAEVLKNDTTVIPDGWDAELVGFVNYNEKTDVGYIQANRGNSTFRAVYGDFSIVDGKVNYKPTKMLSTVQKVFCVIEFTELDKNGNKTTNVHYRYNILNIVPATTMYYETDFADGVFKNVTTLDEWATEGNVSEADGPQDDGTIGKDQTYGYDKSYGNDSELSNGSSLFVEGQGVKKTISEFSFTGTGFDLISRTGAAQGAIRVDIYTDEARTAENREKSITVLNKSESALELYQIPVVSVNDLEYGTYYVTVGVNAAYTNTSYPELSRGGEFYFDAIRIFDPAKGNGEAEAAYKADNEYNMSLIEVRNQILAKEAYDATNTEKKGVTFVDSTYNKDGEGNLEDPTHQSGSVEVADYASIGPNNEVYLANGQGIVFEINWAEGAAPASIDIGAKTITGETAHMMAYISGNTTKPAVAIVNEDIKSSTAQFQNLVGGKAGSFSGGDKAYVFVTNTGEGVLSITDIKIAYADDNAGGISLLSNARTLAFAKACVAPAAEPEEPDTPVTPEEPDTPVTPEDPETPVVPENPVEPEEPETPPVVEEPEEPVAAPAKIISLKTDKQNYVQGDKVKVTVTTNKEATKVKVGTKVLKNYTTKNGNRTWTTTVNATKLGKLTIGAIAYNSKGTATKKVTKVVTVKKFAPRIFNVTLDKYKVKKGQKYTVTVKAGSSVKHVRVNGKKITKFTTKNGVKTFKVTFKANKVGKQKVKVIAYNKALYPTNPKVKTITVTRK